MRPAFSTLVPANDFRDASALVVDGNPQSRSILASQLRDMGLGTVTQCSRVAEARTRLEFATFDLVVCEQYFERESITGQDLLDDLRRNQLLPFYTVFVMITSESAYNKVAEAAESALDAYLLKPHTAGGLAERIGLARDRKLSLKDIFTAIEGGHYEEAAAICKERFLAREPYWLYAARIGAELMVRCGHLAEAQAMYEAVVAAKSVPWAGLGVARMQIETGFPQAAISTLQSLVESEPGFTDAYDVMGRAQFELGRFEEALDTFRMSTQLTPSSINRLMKHGMLAYYAGDKDEGIALLDRATRLGLESKLFDPQALVLLAFARLDDNDAKGLSRCVDQLNHLCNRQPDNPRPKRLLEVVDALAAIQANKAMRAMDEVRRTSKTVRDPAFDFEAASNLLALMTRLAVRSIQLYEVDAAVDTVAQRFCTSRALTELLTCACPGRQDYANRVRTAYANVIKFTEQALEQSRQGDPKGAAQALLTQGSETFNAKTIETCHLVLQGSEDRVDNHAELLKEAQALRERFHTTEIHAGLGEQAHTGRAAGGMSLPSGYKPQNPEGLLAKVSAA